jgi:PAS domain S-box-containing protein
MNLAADTRGPPGVAATIDVILCDDVPELRELTRLGLEQDPRLRVSGEAGSAEECLTLLAEGGADAVLLDLSLPGMDGLEAIPRLRQLREDIVIVVFSGFEAARMRPVALERGADAYLEKGTPLRAVRDTLLAATRSPAAGSNGAPQAVEDTAAAEPEVPRAEIARLAEANGGDRFQLLATRAPVGIWEADLEGRCTFVNQRWAEIAGLPWDEALGEGWAKAVHEDDREWVLETWHAAIRDREHVGREFRVRAPDGRISWVWSEGVPIEAPDGEPVGYLGTLTDVTERRRAEAEFRDLLEAAPDAIVVVDATGSIIRINAQTETMFGYPREELVGKPVETLIPDRFHARHGADRAAYAEHPRARAMGAGDELWAKRKDGSEFPVEVSLSPLDTQDGRLVTAAVRDATEPRRAEREQRLLSAELERRAAELERSNNDLEQFAYVASHDLSEPLHVIRGFAELLEEHPGTVDGTGRRYVANVLAGVERMQTLIDDLLAYSRVGRATLVREPVDTARLVAEVVEMLRPTVKSSGTAITVGDLPEVRAEPLMLAQVFQNLVSNAIKFGDEGVAISVEAVRDDGSWCFSVVDDGPGIDSAQGDRVFEMFQRLHGREVPGTGIGLAICKRVVERHGGRIWYETGEDGGTVFQFTIADPDPERAR